MHTGTLRKLALALTFWLALRFSPLHATDLTVTGNLTVNGTSDLQGDTLTFGMRTDNSNPGAQILYTDGTTSTLEFDASRSANIWKWQENGGTALKLQMSLNLSNDNELVLYDQSSTPAAKITLNPLGTSTFQNSLTINGTDNEMPNQTLVNSNSVLTEGLADSRYLSSSDMTIGSVTYDGVYWSGTAPTLSLNGGTATGAFSFAEGTGSTASGYVTIAMGFHSTANGDNGSTAIGDYTTSGGGGSTAMGSWSSATGNNSTAMGGSTASGEFSTAMGQSTASGNYSTAMGLGSTASGKASMAIGWNSIASGNYSTAMGQSTASGNYSTASGYKSTASGYYSTAIGGSTASGYASTAIGRSITASGNYSTAMGIATTTQAFGSVAIGQANVGGGSPTSWVSTDPLFEIGNGTTTSSYVGWNYSTWSGRYVSIPATLSDAFVVYKNGNAAVQGSLSAGGPISAASLSTTGTITATGVITAAAGGDIPMYSGH